MMVMACLMMTACEKVVMPLSDGNGDESPRKEITFHIEGSFRQTRGYLQADGDDMTDVWVLDYVDGECVQSIHQVLADEDFGEVTMALPYGTHNLYFVASRGTSPTLDTEAHAVTWERPSDTFWHGRELEVSSASSNNLAVTLDRVATKLKITVLDKVPAGTATLALTPAAWYYGLDYLTGEPTEQRSNQERTVNVPASYIGTSGALTMGIYGLSGGNVWNTDVSVVANNASGEAVGTATITAAPFRANRMTEYTGKLFTNNGHMELSLNAEWLESVTGTW